ncbi:class I SAM-dependent methyltransferase [Patescibacteria group bacterium]|nr:class I SAM-dependent methyltransferase [Patescibacteria group bacterium]
MRQKLVNIEMKFWEGRRSNIRPSIFQHDYLAHVGLYQDIKNGLNTIKKKIGKRKFKIIDIGCGDKPYYHDLFKPYAQAYVGVDIEDQADVVAPAEKLPFPDRSFDLVLCFQTLEHSDDPQKAVAEMKRVLKPKGFVLASTHGIWNYHPFPHDYYRWTNEGLQKLFKDFSWVKVKENLKSYSTVIQIVNIELYSLACRNIFLKLPLYAIIMSLNVTGRLLMQYGQKHLSVNYLVLAQR